MIALTPAAPQFAASRARGRIRVEPSTCAIGAELLEAFVPEFQVRFRWRKNSVAIWDNRSTQHYAVQDFWPAVRNLERAGMIGERPA
jgi:alpha-ketoglutarate-dependent taurine dioxygenase